MYHGTNFFIRWILSVEIYPLNFVHGPGITIDTSSVDPVSMDPLVNDIRYQELMKKVKQLSKDKDPKKRIIAQIAKNLLGERERKDTIQNMELVEVLTDKQILQEVRKWALRLGLIPNYKI